jgi:hypothetical protein
MVKLNSLTSCPLVLGIHLQNGGLTEPFPF